MSLEGRLGTDDVEPQIRQNQLIPSIRDTAKKLLSHGHNVVLIYPTPEVRWDVPDEIFRQAFSAHSGHFTNPVTTSTKMSTLVEN
jgi:hypothetical protein